jgi:hypothetical protein
MRMLSSKLCRFAGVYLMEMLQIRTAGALLPSVWAKLTAEESALDH